MSGVTFERLPPERRIAASAVASAGSCCCCCCCCLHTVGSLVGALTAKPPEPPAQTEPLPTAVVGTVKAEPKYKVTKEYWATVLVLATVVTPLVFFVISKGQSEDMELGGWALLYAIVFPAIQLAASLVVALRNAFSDRPGKHERLHHLARITIRAFIGGLIGIMVMLFVFVGIK